MFPDISEHQGAVDWGALGAAYQAGQIEAIAIRAGFGTVRRDDQFVSNQAGARRHGIPTVYYWFNYPTFNTPQAEAAMFNATVGPLESHEAMCGDFEDDGASGSTFPRGQAGVDWAKAFLTALQSPQHATWWYTYPFLLSVIPFYQIYGTWPFWLADYSSASDTAFTVPIARQFTNCGSTPGVVGCCDQSRVLKTPLSQWLTGGQMTPEQADQLKWLFDQWHSGPGAGQPGATLRDYFGDMYNRIAALQPGQPVDLTALKTSLDALSKHLGVGVP